MTTFQPEPWWPASRERWVLHAYGLALVAGLAAFLCRMPLQVSDNLLYLLFVSDHSLSDVVRSELDGPFIRPLHLASIKILYELSGGHLWATYKAFHVAQLVVLALLFSRLLPVRRSQDVAFGALAFCVLFGNYLFAPLIVEAFPVNTGLTVSILCLLSANLAMSTYRWTNDVIASLAALAAPFAVEMGILVWVVVVTSWLAGARGISRRGIVLCTVALVVYVGVRLNVPGEVAPAFDRSTGVGFEMLEPAQVVDRFEGRAGLYYAYNVISAALSALFSEPRGGMFKFIATLREGETPPWLWLNVVSSTLLTALAFVAAVRLRPFVQRLQQDHTLWLVPVFLAVLVVNALVSFPYTRDRIITTIGVFYALSCAALIPSLFAPDTGVQRWRPVLYAALLLVSAGWTLRVVGTAYNMHLAAYRYRNDWVQVDSWLASQDATEMPAPHRMIVERLKAQAIARPVAPPPLVYGRVARYFDQAYQ